MSIANLRIAGRCALLLCAIALLASCLTTSAGTQPPTGVASPAFLAAPPAKVAVVVERSSGTRFSPRDVEDVITTGLMSKNYTVASRSDVETITKEIGFQHSGFTDRDAAEIGRMLNVPAVMIVTVKSLKVNRHRGASKVDGSMGARLISVAGGEVLWINSVNHSPWYYASGNTDPGPAVQAMAAALVNSFPPRASSRATRPYHGG